MRLIEIVGPSRPKAQRQTVGPIQSGPGTPDKPETPQETRKRYERQQHDARCKAEALAHVKDVQQQNALRLAAAKRKLK